MDFVDRESELLRITFISAYKKMKFVYLGLSFYFFFPFYLRGRSGDQYLGCLKLA